MVFLVLLLSYQGKSLFIFLLPPTLVSSSNNILRAWRIFWSLRVKEILIPFILCLSFIFLIIVSYSKYYMEYNKNLKIFAMWMVFFYARIQLLLIRNSFLVLIFAWEGLGLTSFFLVMFYYNWTSCQGASLTFVSNRWGDCFLVRLAFIFGVLNFYFILTITILIFTKRAIFPFSSWLPAAIAAPTPVSALVHSRTLVTAGIALNFKFKICYTSLPVKFGIIFLGLFTIILGSLRALRSVDLKKIVAYTTLSQIGLLIFSLGGINPALTLAYLVVHALLKMGLFILRGVIILLRNSQNLFKSAKAQIKLKLWARVIIILINFVSWFCLSIYRLKEIFIVYYAKIKVSIFMWELLVLATRLTCLYSTRFFVVFIEGRTLKTTKNRVAKMLWMCLVVLFVVVIKLLVLYLKETKNFSIITFEFLILIIFIFFFNCRGFALTVGLLRKLNNILSNLTKIKIFEDNPIFFNFTFFIIFCSKILKQFKIIFLALIILLLTLL